MGHRVGKELYRKLGTKIDHLSVRAPWNDAFYALLKALYSRDEADLVVRMPYRLSSFNRIEQITRLEGSCLRRLLEGLCSKGLVIDLAIRGQSLYMPSPLVIGIFEFTMMRGGKGLKFGEWAKLFHDYLQGDDSFYRANFGSGQKVSVMRALPYEEAVKPSEYVEILDYEKAASIIEEAERFSVGLCSCRHEKSHLGLQSCEVPLETCSSFGPAAEMLIRNGFARESSRSEMLENLARSREAGLVLNADNVRNEIGFICHCCKCCCNALLGVRKFGYANSIVTSTFMAESDEGVCAGCGACAEACPVNAIEMGPAERTGGRKREGPVIDRSICLGCGVCSLKCAAGALKLVKRGPRVIHPETSFQRVILQCLERGTLQYQIFDNPDSLNHRALRGVVGAFLKLGPVQQALMSDLLRSRFLKFMEGGGKGEAASHSPG